MEGRQLGIKKKQRRVVIQKRKIGRKIGKKEDCKGRKILICQGRKKGRREGRKDGRKKRKK